MISFAIIILLFVMVLAIFVGRASELIIMKIQQKAMGPALKKNLEQEPIRTVRQATP